MSLVKLHGKNKSIQCLSERSRDSNSTSSRPRSQNRKGFKECCEVLARWSDGLSYIGIIVEVDDENQRCLVNFEDNSLHWILYKDLQTGDMQSDEIICTTCDGETSDPPNEIVICDRCNRGYHQLCHRPSIPESVLKPDVPWYCRQCIFASAAKRGGARKKGPSAKVMRTMKESLPYNLYSLTWDAHHKTNTQQCYCYCGGSGEWYRKMLQCCRCKQWFHEACLQCLGKPLLLGDRFYIFLCSVCNSGEEYLRRLELKWVDIAHLVLFNLTVEYNKKYFDVESTILPYILKNWSLLQVKGKLVDAKEEEKTSGIYSALNENQARFMCGKEIKKRTTLWGLRVRVAPPVPMIVLPATGPVNDFVMEEMKEKQFRTKMFVPVNNTPIPIKKGKKPTSKQEEISLEQRTANARSALEEAIKMGKANKFPVSTNQSYQGYTGSASCCTVVKHEVPDEDYGSQGTLDSIIPPPTNFEGINHPFWDVDWSKNCSPSSCSVKQKLDRDDIRVTRNGDVRHRYHRRQSLNRSKYQWLNGQTSEGSVDTSSESDNVEVCRKLPVKRTEVNTRGLRSTINNYLGTAHRVENGEKFRVLGKRVATDGKVQYLIEWEGALS